MTTWSPIAPHHRSHLPRRALLAAVVVVALIVVTAAVVTAEGGSSSTTYRTATAQLASVSQQLTLPGTVQPLSGASVAFPVAGQVASVAVKVGDHVSTGQVLASLNTTSLQVTLTNAQAELANGQLNVQKAMNGEAVSITGSNGSSRPATPASYPAGSVLPVVLVSYQRTPSGSGHATATGGPTPGQPGTAATFADLTADQQAVVAGQRRLDADLPPAEQALRDAAAACTENSFRPTTPGVAAATGTTPLGTTPRGTTPLGTTRLGTNRTPLTPNPSTPATGLGSEACSSAQQQVGAAQRGVAQDEQSLAQSEMTLNQLLTAAIANSGSGATNTGSPSGTGVTPTTSQKSSRGSASPTSSASAHTTTAPSRTPGTGSTTGTSGSRTASSTTATSAAPTAEDLVALQAQADAAQTAVDVATQALAQATIVSPMDGTVAQVTLASGESITARSTSQSVVVVGANGDEVSTSVAVANVKDVKVGQLASVSPDGSSETIAGRVVAVGAAPTSASVASYPVVVGIGGPDGGLRDGASVSVTLDLARADHVLTVPTSAVHAIGSRHTVTVLSGDKPSTTLVQVGLVGSTVTQITSGLKAGQLVVLADLSQPLPASGNTSTRSLTGGRSGFGGAGGFGGGAAGRRRAGG